MSERAAAPDVLVVYGRYRTSAGLLEFSWGIVNDVPTFFPGFKVEAAHNVRFVFDAVKYEDFAVVDAHAAKAFAEFEIPELSGAAVWPGSGDFGACDRGVSIGAEELWPVRAGGLGDAAQSDGEGNKAVHQYNPFRFHMDLRKVCT